MWTPKRVLLLLAGFGAFLSSYAAYAFWLGGIDGLPPLPREFEPVKTTEELLPGNPVPKREAERKLEIAFGPRWKEELLCQICGEIPGKNLVLATNDFFIQQEDGRVRLAPFNIAVFGKPEPGKWPEINTVRSEIAYLTFEQPIKTMADMGGKNKIVAAELQENIRIRNNRRTAIDSDDVSLFSKHGPLYFKDKEHLVEVPAEVRLLDEQTKPKPSTIEAVGMRLHLTTDQPAKPGQPPAAHKTKGQSISGLERIELLAAVDMHLWVESSGFLGGNTDKKPQEPAKPEDIPMLHITTQGPFTYNVSQDDKTPDKAVFEVPKVAGQFPEKVTVTRIAGAANQEKRDVLVCDRLELSFSHKGDAPANEAAGRSVSLTIQDAHATGQVELRSETDLLDAVGNDFFYDARTKQSTLKGTPQMYAVKDGHEIFTRELQVDTGQKDVHQAKARGAGRINMLDRATGERTMHATWSESMDFNKENGIDVLTLKGDASFEDSKNPQRLQADILRVWLQPSGIAAPTNGEQAHLKPHHVKATGHVRAFSADVLIKEGTEELFIWFNDVAALPTAAAPAPAADKSPAPAKPNPGSVNPVVPPAAAPAPATPAAPAAAAMAATSTRAPAMAAVPEKPATSATNGLLPNASQGKDKKPIELSARSVTCYVMRCSEKNDLDRVWCEGSVHVHQEPAAPEDKGVDIRGDTLHVKHFVEGNIMDVTGNLAQVQLDKMTILGPAVTIDQRDNLAKVFGIGAMQMLSKSSLQGEALAEPTELTIHWNKSMLFDGKWARFFGGVQALQKDSMMLCQDLQAVLDRPVSFKEGGKGGQSASVQELVCDKNVRIDDIQYEGKQFLRRTRLFAPEVQVNKEESIVNAAGPGQVNILQFGTADDNPPGGAPAQQTAAAPKPAAPAKKEEKELTLTRVNFGQKLYANNKSKLAIFWGSVDVVHVPTDDIDLKVDVNRPPPGCVHMVCERLEVRTITLPDGRTTQQMEAHKRAVVDSAEFWGQADVVKYDQSKELMILEGGEGGMAKLYRVKVPAGKQERMTGKKIWYYRKTNEATIQGGDSLDIRVN